MGGYGALKLAFKYSDFYSAVAASSPVVLLGDDPSELLNGPDPRRSQFFSRLLHRVYGNPVNLEHWKANKPRESGQRESEQSAGDDALRNRGSLQ